MKLYSGDLSPYSARVRLQIYAKGLDDRIPLERPKTFGTPKFREEHPIGRIPVLDLGGGDMMPESEVIAEYIEEMFPTPSMLGADPRETAKIRTLARIGDIYIMNNMFLLGGQTRKSTRVEAVRDLLAGQVVRGLKALEHFIGARGYAHADRLTMADCALVPGLFLVENTLPAADVPDPLATLPKVSAYWKAIQQDKHAARVLAELHRGLEERRELIRSGKFNYTPPT